MPNHNNNAASSHGDVAATGASDNGNIFYFSFPYSKEPTAIAHPSAKFLSQKEKEKFAYEWLGECVLPSYERMGEKNPIFQEIKEWQDKAEYKELIWNMLYGFIVELPTGWDEHTKGAAMSMYKHLENLAEYIYG